MTPKHFYFAIGIGIGLMGLQLTVWGGEADSGRDSYLKYCSSCHGKDGRGNGPVSPYLRVKPADLTLLKKGNSGIFPLRRVMTSIDGSRIVRAHGDREMPVWGDVFRVEVEGQKYEELSSLLKTKIIAEYISTLQR